LTGPDLAIEAVGLVKRFGEVVAVDRLDLQVRRGGVYGLLGPNGAGKTTTIRILASLLRADEGAARIFGHDVANDGDVVRSRISLTGQYASVDEDLTGRENLVLLARLLGHRGQSARRRADELLEAFGLSDAAARKVKTYSGGMRRRLDIAASIVVTPEVLFLDEPTSGLDPRSRRELWDIARALVAGGTTILLTTQYLNEADSLADRIAVIDHGRVIAEGTTSDLKSSVGADAVRVRVRDPNQRESAADVLGRELASEVVRESDPTTLSAQAPDTKRAAGALRALVDSDIDVADFSLGQPSLDDVFLSLTGHPATDEEVPA
jgi:ABC-2 type transport system ATP-binding protein